ncbi:MAG: diguanylate cyclase [Desulfotignum sp.]
MDFGISILKKIYRRVKQKRTRSLKKSLFVSFLFLSLVMVLLFGSLMTSLLYYSGINNAYAIIFNKNKAASNYIEGYFKPLSTAVQLLARQPEVIYAVEDPLSQKEKALSLFETLKNALSNINYIYSGYEDGTLLINNYTPPKGYDPRKRPWYLAALKTAPDISDGIPYQEAVTSEWLVSLSKVLTDDTGNLHGVVTIDASMDSVTKNLYERDPAYPSTYSYVVDGEGTVILHHRDDLLGTKFSKNVDIEDDLSSPAGRLSYTFEQTRKIAYYTKLESLGWSVITVFNKQEVLKLLIVRILLSLAVVIAVSLLLGQIISRTLSNKIIAPLRTLEQRVRAAISGSFQTDDQTKLSLMSKYSEIDSIANHIEQLTEQSLLQKNQELEAKNELLEKVSQTDYLTGLLNRRKINEEMEKEYQRAIRYGCAFSIIILDIDWFKSVNDAHGHNAGDQVLKEMSDILSSMLRTTDSLARWGGEEFLILCPGITLEASAEVAQRIQAAIEENSFSVPKKITISAGTCEYRSGHSLEGLLVEADRKLYKAKSLGRNRVVF